MGHLLYGGVGPHYLGAVCFYLTSSVKRWHPHLSIRGGSDMEHTDECWQRQVTALRVVVSWIDKWPNHCRVCGASGIVHGSEQVPRPFGPGAVSMPTQDVCGCYGDGNCPRCGEQVWSEDDMCHAGAQWSQLCPECGWQDTGEVPFVRPWEWECYGGCQFEEVLRMVSVIDTRRRLH